MKKLLNQIETMGLTVIKNFTGINAEKEPHVAFLQMLCDYRYAHLERVLFLTGLTSDEYEKVFQENSQKGVREIKLDPAAFATVLCTLHLEDILPHQEKMLQLLLSTMLDYVGQVKDPEGDWPFGLLSMDNVLKLENVFQGESAETFAYNLNEAIMTVWLFIKVCEIEQEKDR